MILIWYQSIYTTYQQAEADFTNDFPSYFKFDLNLVFRVTSLYGIMALQNFATGK